jgi:alkyl sulfatase BDS1-like metallo-beta-lactamase superfamily hydrolase
LEWSGRWQTTFAEAAASGQIAVAGDPGKLIELLGLFDDFDPMFGIVAPKRP